MPINPTEVADVVIVGAGPTGLSAACDLARRGLTVRIIDRAAGPGTGSRGKGLQPRTLEVLDNLGVAGRLVATGRFRLPVCFHGPARSRTVADLSDGTEPTVHNPYARTLVIPQWRVEQVLRDRLGTEGVTVEFGRTLTELDQHDDHVTLTCADHGILRARWVIGADGGSSTVRHLLGVSFLGSTDASHRMLVADVRLDGLDRDHWHLWPRSDGSSLALCPIPASDSFQLQAPLAPGDTHQAMLTDLQDIIDTVLGSGAVHLHEAGWLSTWRLNVRMVDQYRQGRVFLTGDAAHVHSPAGGQGMNTGIQDAINLGWKLAAVTHGASPTLLDTYQAERLPVAAAVLGLTTHITPSTSGPADGNVEDEEHDWTEMRQLGITYRDSPLAPHDDTPAPRPGDRGPDAPCQDRDGRPVRLFDLQRGTHWTLYSFTTPPPDLGTRPGCEIRAFRITANPNATTNNVNSDPSSDPSSDLSSDIADTEGHAHHAYTPRSGELVLIRPDGHLATRTTDPAALSDYLDTHLARRPTTAIR